VQEEPITSCKVEQNINYWNEKFTNEKIVIFKLDNLPKLLKIKIIVRSDNLNILIS